MTTFQRRDPVEMAYCFALRTAQFGTADVIWTSWRFHRYLSADPDSFVKEFCAEQFRTRKGVIAIDVVGFDFGFRVTKRFIRMTREEALENRITCLSDNKFGEWSYTLVDYEKWKREGGE